MISKKQAIYCLAFIFLTIIYFFFVFRNGVSSDQASFFLEAADIANGNLTLIGWNLSTVNFYFTEMVPFAIMIKLFGQHNILLWLIPSAYFSLIMVLSASLIKNRYGLIVLSALIIPCSFSVFTTINACVHIGSLIVALITIKYLERELNALNIIALSFINGLTIFSDSLFLYFLTLPLIVSLVLHPLLVVARVRYKALLIPLLSILLSIVLAKGLANIDHFYIQGYSKPQFVSLDKLNDNLYYFSYGLVRFFGADFFGKNLSDISGIKSFIRFASTLSVLIFGFMLREKNKPLNAVDYFLLSSILILPTAFIFSNMPVDALSIRYLLPTIVMCFILMGRNLQVVRKSVILVFLPAIVIMATNISDWKTHYRDSAYIKAARFIDEEHLGDGYASFWYSTSISIQSSSNITIGGAMIDPPMNRLKPYDWLSHESWYKNKSRYYIAKDSDEIEQMAKIFGSDYEVRTISGIKIMIYPDQRIVIR